MEFPGYIFLGGEKHERKVIKLGPIVQILNQPNRYYSRYLGIQ